MCTYLVFLLQSEHGSQVLSRDACLADALLLHKPGLLLFMVLQELEEVACILKSDSPTLTALNKAANTRAMHMPVRHEQTQNEGHHLNLCPALTDCWCGMQ
jgi:hypothetical protein